MQTKTVKIDSNNIDQNAMAEAAEIIRQGGLVAFPTETVYGLGADALRPEASKKIYEAKGADRAYLRVRAAGIDRKRSTQRGQSACGCVLAGTAYHDRLEK